MRNSVLDIKQFTPRAEVLEALQKETSKGHPLTCLAYDGDWGSLGWQVVNIVKYDAEDEWLMTADHGCHPVEEIRLLSSAIDADLAAHRIASNHMICRLDEKRQSKYPNAEWTQCSESELKSLANNALEKGKYIDAMNYLAFAVALGYDY